MSKLPDHIGIDFGNLTIKALELNDISSKTPELSNFGTQATPKGALNSQDSAQLSLLSDAVRELLKNTKFKSNKAVISLPESMVFTRYMELPGVKDDEIMSAVFYEAKQYLPVDVESVQMSFIKIGFNPEKNAQKVLLVAAHRKTIDSYLSVADKAGLDVIAIETESVAIGRTVFHATNTQHCVMLDFGAETTDMSIMYEGFLVFSQSISIGSAALTQTLVNQFNFDYQQAEEYKKNYGLTQGVLEDKVVTALRPIMDSIIVEVQRGIEFYKSKTLLPAPRAFYLNGDGAMLPGLSEYLTTAMGVEGLIGDPFTNIKVPEKFVAQLEKSKPSFAVAMGLALKSEV